MKKAKKLLALISSVVMIASIGAMSVSAGIAGEYRYVKYVYNYMDQENLNKPFGVIENLYYDGIVITMPDGVEPTNDMIGLDCEISDYSEGLNQIGHADAAHGVAGWQISNTVDKSENRYLLDVDDILSEDEAIEFSEKLVIRGIADESFILYKQHLAVGNMETPNGNFVLNVVVNNSSTFNVEDYPEFEEAGFVYSYDEYSPSHNSENTIYWPSFIYNQEKYSLDYVSCYEDIVNMSEKILERYDEIESINMCFSYNRNGQEAKTGSYSIKPIWGDATNDDKVDLYDAIEIAKYIMDISEFDEDTKLLADINRDGVTDLYDAIEIARIIMEESKVG